MSRHVRGYRFRVQGFRVAVILRLYWGNEIENGNYYVIIGLCKVYIWVNIVLLQWSAFHDSTGRLRVIHERVWVSSSFTNTLIPKPWTLRSRDDWDMLLQL